MDRVTRVNWARTLYRKTHVSPRMDIRLHTTIDTEGTHDLNIRFETLITVFSGKGYAIVADHYRQKVDTLKELNDYVGIAATRFQEFVKRAEDNFIANKDSDDHWFTRKEIEK